MQFLQADNLKIARRISHGFFTRAGGVSDGIYTTLNCGPGSGDVREHVIANRDRVREALTAHSLVSLYQIHSDRVVTVTRPWDIGEGPRADAMATATPGIALGILTADCAPVLFADEKAHVIGAAHAGWKGALSGVVESVLTAMEALGADRANTAAAIGPCIAQASYEVGAEFLDAFKAADSTNEQFFTLSDRAGHLRFDLEAYVVHRVREAGVENVQHLSADTYVRESEFFSYRRATHRGEKDYGRQISAIVLSE